MNGSVPKQTAWSTRRWTLTVLLLFFVQVAVAWKFADRSPLNVRNGGPQLRVQVVPEDSSPQLAALLRLSDPTLFVLPGRDGFSGTAWLKVTAWEHRTPGWSSAPEWLALRPADLLVDMGRFGVTNPPPRTPVSDRLSRPRDERVALSDALRPSTGTRIALAGEVSLNDLATTVPFPDFEHAGLLAPTVVVLQVDQRGQVFQASLAPGGTSGSPAADLLALELARKLVFKIDPGVSTSVNARDFERLRRGRLTIQWWTHPPAPATNAPPAATSPPVTS